MKLNTAGLDLIKRWEGLRLTSYLCPAAVWTIGFGHTGHDVHEGQTITEAEADLLLRQDVDRFEKGVTDAVDVPLTDNQFSACVSLAYNIGLAAFRGSTLLRTINAGKPDPDAFMAWNKARVKGVLQALPGLTARRFAERQLFRKP